jgi:serine/threonine protein kinase
MEYAAGGDMLNFLKRKVKLSEEQAKFYFRQLLLGA